MNKDLLIREITNKIDGVTKKDIAVVVDVLTETIMEAVTAGDKVNIAGFGAFESVERAARKGRNPKTSEEIMIPASKAIKFKAAKNFKDTVNA